MTAITERFEKFSIIPSALITATLIAATSLPAWAQVILDPTGTVTGTVGLDGETFGNGSAQHYTGTTWLIGTIDPATGIYEVPVAAGRENFDFYLYLYNFADTNSAQLQYRVYNQPSVAEGATATLDLKGPGGFISGSVDVNNGAVVESISMNTYGTDATVPAQYNGYVTSNASVDPQDVAVLQIE